MGAIGAKIDFEKILAERGESVSWYVNTEGTDAQSGDPIESFGAATSITVIIITIPKKDIYNSAGEITDQHSRIFTDADDAIAIKDKILHNSVSYTVDKIEKEIFDSGILVCRKILIRRLVSDA